MNLYGYVGGDPVGLVDPKGLAWSISEHDGSFSVMAERWLENNRDTFWATSLPDCPCEKPERDGTWVKEDQYLVKLIYHRGSSSCVRTGTQMGGYAQQCCYDENNKLITSDRAAGTPDKVSSLSGPFAGKLEHYDDDVKYFPYMSRNEYHEVRPPNNGNNCCENEK